MCEQNCELKLENNNGTCEICGKSPTTYQIHEYNICAFCLNTIAMQYIFKIKDDEEQADPIELLEIASDEDEEDDYESEDIIQPPRVNDSDFDSDDEDDNIIRRRSIRVLQLESDSEDDDIPNDTRDDISEISMFSEYEDDSESEDIITL